MSKINIGNMIKAGMRGYASLAGSRALLIAISGIDAAGKSTLAGKLAYGLREEELNVATISVEKWHDPRRTQLGNKPVSDYYQNAYKPKPLFEKLVLPLKQARSVSLQNAIVEVANGQHRTQNYSYEAVDVIILEGIFLLKPALLAHYDLSFWVECSFTTALRRALKVKPKGISVSQFMANFQKIYFPAQRLHIERDAPQAAATAIYPND